MKVLFDSQVFDWQINGGISRYFVEVFHRLNRHPDIEVMFKCRHSYNTYLQNTQWLTNSPKFRNLHFKGKLSILKQINQKINRPWSNRILKKGMADIFHPTYYDPYFIENLGKTPFVLTVYDLTNERYNDGTALTAKVLDWKKKLIHAAHHIVSISENTKNDIVEYYNIAPQKITTVYLSGGFDISMLSAAPLPDMNAIPDRYVLFVGSRSAYKNFAGFVREIAPVLRAQNLFLVAAGGGPMNSGELSLINELNIQDRIIAFQHVSDNLLVQLYKKALFFIFPSLYEGFGIPVLESMQCGCPALLSNNSSLPEVGGDAAVYFDPLQKGSLAGVVESLANDESRRQQMRELGFAQVKNFSWDHTAEGHVQVYKSIA